MTLNRNWLLSSSSWDCWLVIIVLHLNPSWGELAFYPCIVSLLPSPRCLTSAPLKVMCATQSNSYGLSQYFLFGFRLLHHTVFLAPIPKWGHPVEAVALVIHREVLDQYGAARRSKRSESSPFSSAPSFLTLSPGLKQVVLYMELGIKGGLSPSVVISLFPLTWNRGEDKLRSPRCACSQDHVRPHVSYLSEIGGCILSSAVGVWSSSCGISVCW